MTPKKVSIQLKPKVTIKLKSPIPNQKIPGRYVAKPSGKGKLA